MAASSRALFTRCFAAALFAVASLALSGMHAAKATVLYDGAALP